MKKKIIFFKNIILSSHDTLKSLSIKQRSKYLLDVAYLMEARLDEFTLMEYIQRSGMYVWSPRLYMINYALKAKD